MTPHIERMTNALERIADAMEKIATEPARIRFTGDVVELFASALREARRNAAGTFAPYPTGSGSGRSMPLGLDAGPTER